MTSDSKLAGMIAHLKAGFSLKSDDLLSALEELQTFRDEKRLDELVAESEKREPELDQMLVNEPKKFNALYYEDLLFKEANEIYDRYRKKYMAILDSIENRKRVHQ